MESSTGMNGRVLANNYLSYNALQTGPAFPGNKYAIALNKDNRGCKLYNKCRQVLCEVLCARPPTNRLAEKSQVNLAMWAQKCYRNGTLYQIIDAYLIGYIAPQCLKKYAEVATSCLHDEGIQRLSISDVGWGLEFDLQLQESAEEEIKRLKVHSRLLVEKHR
ncbi:hypothetical protein REPUB_Repub12eG0042400 [Reevesia pubescens]